MPIRNVKGGIRPHLLIILATSISLCSLLAATIINLDVQAPSPKNRFPKLMIRSLSELIKLSVIK
jgi:hypothetical protein